MYVLSPADAFLVVATLGTAVLIEIAAFIVMGLMTVIEVFQLTQIPLLLSRSSNILLRMVALLLGTKFEWLDLASYLIGIILIFLLDQFGFRKFNSSTEATGKST